METSIIKNNKYAYFKYSIAEEFEAGIALKGKDVKSIKNKEFEVRDAFIRVDNNEIFLWNIIFSHTPGDIQKRKLLLHKSEIEKIATILKDKTYHGFLLKVRYTSNKLIKCVIGIGRVKKARDKKFSEKRTTEKRILEREMKSY